jgi:hypothetical protein
MNGNIVGEPIDEFVQRQIGIRQSNQFSGYRYPRTSSELKYLNNRNAWVKLASSVKIVNPNRLSDIGIINPSRFNNTGLAEKAILFNTLSSYTNNKSPLSSERAGVGKEITATIDSSTFTDGILTNISISNVSDLWNDTFAYGIGGSNFGLQPPPGIIGVQVDSLNRGSIRKANITLKAHNKFQFDIIELLYLRLGFTMMLEWGWDKYLDNGGNLQPVENTIIEEKWFTSNSTTQRAMLNNIQSLRKKYVGNYDGFFGKVSNFTWSFNPDGSYDISIDLITLGDVIESLKVNTLAKTITTEGKTGTINFKEGTNLFGTNISKVTNINTIGYFLYTKIFELTNEFSTNQNIASTDTNYYSITPKVITINSQGTSTTTPIASNPGNEGWSPQYYIRLGEFFSQLERLVVPVVKNGAGSSVSQITFNGLANLISYFPNQIPLDPRVCVFKPSINSQGDMEGIPIPAELNNIPVKYVTTVGGRTYGQLSNLYINFEFIAGLLVSNGGPDQELPLIKFLQDLCNGINSALGGFNKLEPVIKDDNIVTIIDQTLSFSGAQNFINLEVYGYNPKNQTSNFVKDIKFVSKITPQLASMVSIGATAAGNNTAEIDGTAFSKFSEGLVDRFTQRISEPNGLSDLQKKRTEQEQQQQQQEDETLYKYAQDTFKTFPTAASTKVTETYQSLDEFAETSNLFFAELLGLEDVPIPFTGGKSISDLAREAIAANDEMKDTKIVTDEAFDIINKPLTYQEYLYEILLFQQNLKNKGAIPLGEVSKLTLKNYALYLSLAFGAETEITVFIKSFTTSNTSIGIDGVVTVTTRTPSKFLPLKQFRYLEFNEAFIAEGKAAYKNYITNLNNETYIENLTPSSGIGFIPLSFELTLDGISGIKIYNQLSINNEFLPSNYPKSLKFVITKVNHQIVNNSWNTSLSTISIPRTEPYKFVESPTILSNTGGGSGAGNLGPEEVDGVQRVSLTTGIPLDAPNMYSTYKARVIYRPIVTKKTMIVLHHTAGEQKIIKGVEYGGIESTIGGWRNSTSDPVSTHYIIDRNGRIEQLYEEKYFGYHASNSAVSAASIGVELISTGTLVDKNGQWYWWPPKPNQYKTLLADQASAVQMVDKDGKPITKPYRGKTHFQGYTPKQIAALEALIGKWKIGEDWEGNKTDHQLNLKFNYDDLFPGMGQDEVILSSNATSLIPGVYSHNSTDTQKADILPQKELVDMLKRVLV